MRLCCCAVSDAISEVGKERCTDDANSIRAHRDLLRSSTWLHYKSAQHLAQSSHKKVSAVSRWKDPQRCILPRVSGACAMLSPSSCKRQLPMQKVSEDTTQNRCHQHSIGGRSTSGLLLLIILVSWTSICEGNDHNWQQVSSFLVTVI